ncbi:MAG: leucine-rich repeat domain-containing protein [Oscillospiraceae bacterium]|nr:leucine-rich repeat domain-containing protein [Oscillospiraceae bacterium]
MKKMLSITLVLLLILMTTVACDIMFAAMDYAADYGETDETYPNGTDEYEDYDYLEYDQSYEEEETSIYYNDNYNDEIQYTPDVVTVYLHSNHITNERLAEMVESGEIPAEVTHLVLASNYITNLSPLSSLTNLVDLNLWGNEITDLSPLSNLTNITHLNLWGNQFYDLSPIANLTNLVDLAVGDNLNFNGDLSVLRNFTKLTRLGLGDTWGARMDFSPIGMLVNLEELQLWGAISLDDLSIFNNLENLRHLTIHASSVNDFSPISNLTNLTRLDLQQNRINDISQINFGRLTNLTDLFLWSNQITDITPLSELTNLTFLALNDNQISDVSPLKGLTGLRSLQLDDNRLSSEQIDELRIALPNCDMGTTTFLIDADGGSIIIEFDD